VTREAINAIQDGEQAPTDPAPGVVRVDLVVGNLTEGGGDCQNVNNRRARGFPVVFDQIFFFIILIVFVAVAVIKARIN
jgi:hypothetical protein